MPPTRRSLADILYPTRRSVFVSYHHKVDRPYYSSFSNLMSDAYDVVDDNSVDRVLDSDDAEYVIRSIRENYITGTSCTLVLCGAETAGRKFVDWEIKATLDKCHGLVGVRLPTCQVDTTGAPVVPARLYDNIASGYAVWTDWPTAADPVQLKLLVEQANAKDWLLLRNSRELRTRNS